MTDSTHRSRPHPQVINKWMVLASVVFGVFMVILDSTVVNVAFRTLQEEFNAGVNHSQWIISIYIMALGISTPLSGFLGDRFGMKRIFLIGLAIFVIGSFLCGLAPNLNSLIAARALQGFGGGIALPLGTAYLFSAFPPEEQGKALGIFGIALVMAPAMGRCLGAGWSTRTCGGGSSSSMCRLARWGWRWAAASCTKSCKTPIKSSTSGG